jgi:hypothetical protein
MMSLVISRAHSRMLLLMHFEFSLRHAPPRLAPHSMTVSHVMTQRPLIQRSARLEVREGHGAEATEGR